MSVSSEYGKLRKVLLCRPTYYSWQPINEIAQETLRQTQNFRIEDAERQHQEFSEAFKSAGVEVSYIKPIKNLSYQVYTRDLGITTGKGVLIGRFREDVRKGEKNQFEDYCTNNGIKVLGNISKGAFEGGDVHYIDDDLIVCGLGARSNEEGIENATKVLNKEPGIQLLTVKFQPKYLHLDLIFVRISRLICLACTEAITPAFNQVLKQKKIEIIDISPEEAMELKCNVISIDEKTVLSFKENTETNKKLEAIGFNVLKPDISIFTRGGGGPRCLSFPLERDKV